MNSMMSQRNDAGTVSGTHIAWFLIVVDNLFMVAPSGLGSNTDCAEGLTAKQVGFGELC